MVSGPKPKAAEIERILIDLAHESSPCSLDSLPAAPGLYTLWVTDASALADLGLEDVSGEELLLRRALYLGKAEDSILKRVRNHYQVGRTGWSTLRRSLAGLLCLQPAPRPSKLGTLAHRQLMVATANFGLTETDEERLTEWMRSRLRIRATTSSFSPLKKLEQRIGGEVKPPLDQEKSPLWEPNPWREQVTYARQCLRNQTRRESV